MRSFQRNTRKECINSAIFLPQVCDEPVGIDLKWNECRGFVGEVGLISFPTLEIFTDSLSCDGVDASWRVATHTLRNLRGGDLVGWELAI
jgi:hypothetical protein